MAKAKKGSWIVRMKCEVDKEVVCNDCTEEQARENPWDYAVDEREVGQTDCKIESVKPND